MWLSADLRFLVTLQVFFSLRKEAVADVLVSVLNVEIWLLTAAYKASGKGERD